MPVTRSSREGLPSTPWRTAILAPSGRFSASHSPASTPPALLSVATTEVLPSQSGMSLSTRITTIPASTAFCRSSCTFGLVGVIDDRVDLLGHERLDGSDLALVVGAALALRVENLGPVLAGIPLLGRVDHDVVEVDRELRDQPDREGVVAAVARCLRLRRRSGRRRSIRRQAVVMAATAAASCVLFFFILLVVPSVNRRVSPGRPATRSGEVMRVESSAVSPHPPR